VEPILANLRRHKEDNITIRIEKGAIMTTMNPLSTLSKSKKMEFITMGQVLNPPQAS